MNDTTLPRRKPRVCTREACETCREKKAKCDGEQPCSRCEARGLECRYQIRNHRTKHSLRNELNILKEKQRWQEVLLAALQDPQRRVAALQLLEKDDPAAEAAKLWLRDEIDTETDIEQHSETNPTKFSDERATSESASSFPNPSTPQHTKEDFTTFPETSDVSSVRRDSMIPGLPASEKFSIPSESNRVDNQMNPLSMDSKTLGFSQYSQPFPTATGGPAMNEPQYTQQVDNSGQMFTPPWLDPSLAGNSNPAFPQQKNTPYQPIPDRNMQAWAGDAGNPSMSQAYSTQEPSKFDNTQFGQWEASQIGDRKLSTGSSPTAPNSVTMPFNIEAPLPPNFTMTDADWMPMPPAYTKAGGDSRPRNPRTPPADSKLPNGKLQPRSKSRERHRLASARNWHKQKQATADLQATKDRVEAQHAALKEEYNDVLNQVQEVKHALLGHAGCNDPAIKWWLERETNGLLNGLQKPASDGGADAQRLDSRHASIGDGTEIPYPTPEDDNTATEERVPRVEGDEDLMRGVDVNATA